MRFLLWVFAAISMANTARAAVVMKHQGTRDGSFRVKTVRAHTVIENGVASTSLVWTFADSQRRGKPEVEFFYAAPPRGVVTFFAYWFRGERVVARVVEKEKASSIYDQLTRWGVDPALIELDGKNTFRARIFPVEANQDVRVEMHLVQPLEATREGWKWALPLRQSAPQARRISKWLPALQRAAPVYDAVQIEVKTRQQGMVNFAGAQFSEGKWRFKGQKVAADRDFELQLPRPSAPLRANLYSSRAGGRDGYFSLLLSPSQAMKNPRLHIAGVRTFTVFPAKIASLGAGESVMVSGRYRGAGAATVSLSDGAQKFSNRVQFSTRRGANNPAAKLWASRQIAALGVNEANRARVIALSKRWSLPSAHTSWLAVPLAEKINFERTKANAEKQKLARQVASDLVLNRAASATKKRAALSRLYKGDEIVYHETYVRNAVNGALKALSSDLATAHENERLEARPDAKKLAILRSQLRKALRASDSTRSPEAYLRVARQGILQKQQTRLAPEYVEAVLYEGENSARALRLKKKLDQLKKEVGYGGYDPVKWGFYQQIREPLHQLAYEKLREEARLNPNRTKIAEIDADMKRLTGLTYRKKPDEWLTWQSHNARRDALHELLGDYRAEAENSAPDQTKIAALRARIGEVAIRNAWEEDDKTNPLDAPEIKAAQKSGEKRELLAQIDRKREFFARPGDPLIEVNAPADCAGVIAILPSGEIKKLTFNARTGRWEVRFDIPTSASEGEYRVQIIAAHRDGTRQKFALRYQVDMTAPQGAGAIVRSGSGLLLQIEAESGVDRVSAFLPWGERVELRRNGPFFAAPCSIPATWNGAKPAVRFVLTDKAHNRTEIFVDWN